MRLIKYERGDVFMNGRTNTTIGQPIYGAMIPLEAPTDLSTKSLDKQAEIKWTDPVDKVASPGGEPVSTYAYSLLIRKESSEPLSPSDGIPVIQTTSRDQYKDNPYVDKGLTNGTKYYYRAFACTDIGVVSEGSLSGIATPRNAYPVKLGTSDEGLIEALPNTGIYYNGYLYTAEGIDKGIIMHNSSSITNYRAYLYAYDKDLVQTSSKSDITLPYAGLNVAHLDEVGFVSIGGGTGSGTGSGVYSISDELVASSITTYPRIIGEGITTTFRDHILMVENNDGYKGVYGYDKNFVLITAANLPYLFSGNMLGTMGAVTYGYGTASANDHWMMIGGIINAYGTGDDSWNAYCVALNPDYVQTDLGKCDTNFAMATGISTERYNLLTYGSTTLWNGNNANGAEVYDNNLTHTTMTLDMTATRNRKGGNIKHTHGILTGGQKSDHSGSGSYTYDTLMIDDNLVQTDMGTIRWSNHSCTSAYLLTYDKYAIAITPAGKVTLVSAFAVE